MGEVFRSLGLPGRATPRDRAGRIEALDGLRGLAVAAVLVYHGGFTWMKGGYLGVSLFFTLSGFLITRLLLDDLLNRGWIDLPRFWSRRFRRLAPASVLVLGLVVLWNVGVGWAGTRGLKGDVIASLLQLTNWWFVREGRSYGALFGEASPVQHYWSLAVEEQFYLVYPFVLGPVVAAARRWKLNPLAVAGGVLVALTLCSGALATFVVHGDRAYFGTDTRAAELLLGGVLAVAVRARPAWALGVLARVRWGTWVPWACAAATSVLWCVAAQGSPWWSRGGFVVVGLLSVGLVAGALDGGRFARSLSWGPLAYLGRVSYGVYLFHWPVMRILNSDRLGGPHVVRFAVQMALTGVLAEASARFWELPVRERKLLPTARAARTVWVAGVGVVLAVALVMPAPEAGVIDVLSGEGPTTTLPKEKSKLEKFLSPLPLLTTVGDSVAFTLGLTVGAWGVDHQLFRVDSHTEMGCPILTGLPFKWGPDEPESPPVACPSVADYLAIVNRSKPQVVLFATGAADLAVRRFEGRWRVPSDPTLAAAVGDQLRARLEALRSTGAVVLLLDVAYGSVPSEPGKPVALNDRGAVDALNEVIHKVADPMPGVEVVSLAALVNPRVGDRDLRPDGFHVTGVDSQKFADDQLMPALSAARVTALAEIGVQATQKEMWGTPVPASEAGATG